METKKDIRKQVFSLRKKCSDQEVMTKSIAITDQILGLPVFQQAKRIYAYIDCKQEVSTVPLIEAAWAMGKKVAVPKVVGKDMVFYKLNNFDQLALGYYDIPEPAYGEIVQWEDALMVMPGVAFDPKCHRIGYGGGFYGRFLAVHNIPTLALAFEFQIFETVPWEDFDLLPDMVVSETCIYSHK